MSAGDRLTSFLVAHERCSPGPQVAELTEADLTERGYWVTIKCHGCGATIREEEDRDSAFRDLARYAGVTVDDLLEGAVTPEEIERRIEDQGRAVPDILIQIMRARGEQQNN